jgi:hypothetical protein
MGGAYRNKSNEEQFNISQLILVGGAVGAMREVIF